MNVGYSSTDPAQVHRQITDMISRGIDGVIVDWYGPNNSIDQATKLVMAEAERHPGFTFAIMVDQGAIQWDSCTGCSPQQALISQLQYYIELAVTYFPSPAYLTHQGKPVITNFNIDLSYSVDWNAVAAALATQPVFLFQNNDGFGHVLSEEGATPGSCLLPTTIWDEAISPVFMPLACRSQLIRPLEPLTRDSTILLLHGARGVSWASNAEKRGCRHFPEISSLYNSGRQVAGAAISNVERLRRSTTEIESGISSCLTLSASAAGNSLQWTIHGDPSTVDHYVAYTSAQTEAI